MFPQCPKCGQAYALSDPLLFTEDEEHCLTNIRCGCDSFSSAYVYKRGTYNAHERIRLVITTIKERGA